MVGWHHRLSGHEFESTAGVDDGQKGLACCSPWGHKELDRTDKLNRTEVKINSEGLGHILILLFISQLLIEKELFFGVQGYVKHEGPSPTRIKLMPPALGAGSLILWISGKF